MFRENPSVTQNVVEWNELERAGMKNNRGWRLQDRICRWSVHNKKGIAVIPSSGNCVVIVPIERGLNQFKTE